MLSRSARPAIRALLLTTPSGGHLSFDDVCLFSTMISHLASKARSASSELCRHGRLYRRPSRLLRRLAPAELHSPARHHSTQEPLARRKFLHLSESRVRGKTKWFIVMRDRRHRPSLCRKILHLSESPTNHQLSYLARIPPLSWHGITRRANSRCRKFLHFSANGHAGAVQDVDE